MISTYSSPSQGPEPSCANSSIAAAPPARRLEREVRKTRTRVERELRERRRELEQQREQLTKSISSRVEQTQAQIEKTQTQIEDALRARLEDGADFASRVQERVLNLV